MKKIIYLVLFILVLISCNQANKKNAPEMKNEIKYLALGDSYTIGQSVTEQMRFPVLLVNELKEKDYKIAPARIIAKTGWTTNELKQAIVDSTIKEIYDIVSLLIGVNNQYRGYGIEEFRQQYIELLEMAIDFAGNDSTKVFVVSIPDWSVSPFAKDRELVKIAMEIDQFNVIKREETEKRNVCFVDITEISRLADGQSNYIASDGLHFSGEMHKLWVKEIIKTYFDK